MAPQLIATARLCTGRPFGGMSGETSPLGSALALMRRARAFGNTRPSAVERSKRKAAMSVDGVQRRPTKQLDVEESATCPVVDGGLAQGVLDMLVVESPRDIIPEDTVKTLAPRSDGLAQVELDGLAVEEIEEKLVAAIHGSEDARRAEIGPEDPLWRCKRLRALRGDLEAASFASAALAQAACPLQAALDAVASCSSSHDGDYSDDCDNAVSEGDLPTKSHPSIANPGAMCLSVRRARAFKGSADAPAEKSVEEDFPMEKTTTCSMRLSPLTAAKQQSFISGGAGPPSTLPVWKRPQLASPCHSPNAGGKSPGDGSGDQAPMQVATPSRIRDGLWTIAMGFSPTNAASS